MKNIFKWTCNIIGLPFFLIGICLIDSKVLEKSIIEVSKKLSKED